MARAKRTNRAEARRRHRAALAEEPELLEEAEAEPTAAAESKPARSAAVPRQPLERPSLIRAFRTSFRPIDLRTDLQALPSLIRHKSVWLPILLTVGAAAFYLGSPNTLSFLLFNYFAYVPPVASIFLAGFLAPRASYLTGLIAGIVGAAVFSVVAVISVGQPTPTGDPVDQASVSGNLALAWSVSPISGIFFGAAAGWYRRFLAAANPNRMNRPPQRPNDRTRRKGSEQRPMLARRR